MKLNLLPTYVSKGSQAKTATVVAVLLAIIGIVGAVAMIFISKGQLTAAREDAQSKLDNAAQAVAISKQADDTMAKAQMIIRNTNLADAMLKHSDVYPDLYNSLKPYIPGFFGVRSMTVTPNDAKTSTVTITGTVKTFQQYADLMIALYRCPFATSVSRAGYTNVDPYIPGLTDTDQNGRPVKPGDANVPDDKYQRLAYYQQRGTVTGFTGTGGYGTTDTTTARGPMPGYSLVTVQVVIAKGVQTPDPGATLRLQTAAGGGGGTATAGPGAGPSIPGPGSVGGPGAAPAGVSGARGGGGGGKKGAGADSD